MNRRGGEGRGGKEMKQDKETGRKKKKKEERYTKNIPKALQQ